MARLLFLDRDGTLNGTLDGRPPNRPDEVRLLPNVGPVLSRYVAEGWSLVIVTNQGGVASGFMDEAQARAIMQRVIDLLPAPVAAAYFCPHMPHARVARYALDCPNRKPRPGFILQALACFDARAEDCLFVGDSITDREAARAAGVPFRWADLFFDRPIDRGIQTSDGSWFAVRQDPACTGERLCLSAMLKEQPAGRLELAHQEWAPDQIRLRVDPGRNRREIEAALIEAALDWARANAPGSICVPAPTGDAACDLFARLGFHPGDDPGSWCREV